MKTTKEPNKRESKNKNNARAEKAPERLEVRREEK